MGHWTDNSQVVVGAIIACEYDPMPDEHMLRIPVSQVRPEIIDKPYDEIVKMIQAGAKLEDIASKKLNSYQTCLHAVRNVNGASEGIDCVSSLERSAAEYQAGQELDRFSKRLMRGDDVDWTKLAEIASIAQREDLVDAYIPLSEIERTEVPFIETGFMPLDAHLGGIPATGLTTFLGTPGIGKTSFAVGLAASFVKKHPDKYVAFHTMEMLREEVSLRFDEIEKLPKHLQEHILIRDLAETPEEMLAKASTVDNLGLIVGDFVEYMVPGEITEAAMSHVFHATANGSKNLRIPAVLLAQVAKGSYKGGIPMPHHVYYTDAAQKFSWMFLSAYNPHIIKHYTDDPHKDMMMIKPGHAAIVCWKSRGGFRVHPKEAPGGVIIQWNGKRGWRADKPGIWRKVTT